MHFELVTQEYNPDDNEYYDYDPKYWDEEQQMWMDSETGLPWCDHEWDRVNLPNVINGLACNLCGEKTY